jgi:outer membrane receptor protein involved in Fe transport
MACCVCLLLCGAAVAQPAQPALQGRPLQQVLDEYREAGLPLVYSTSLVTADLQVQAEPFYREPVLLLEEILAPHGLTLREEAGVYLVIRRATAPEAADTLPAARETPVAPDHDPLELEQLSVSASRYVLWSNSQFLVDQRAIQALPDLGEDPVRSAQRLPGAAAGGLSSRAHFRGGEHNETAIYLNGLKLLDPFHIRDYHSIFSTIDARAISGVEAYTGGFPADYGDRMSGVLLFDTRRPEEPLQTELGLSVYNTSMLNSGFAADGKVDWLVSARASNLDLVLSDDLGKPDYFDVFAELGVNLSDDHRIALNVLYSDDQVVVITENDPAELEQSVSDTQNEHVWLSLEDQWGPHLSSLTVLSYASLENRRDAEVNDPERMIAAVADLRSAEIHGLQQEWRYAGLGSHLLGWGFELRREQAQYDYRSTASYTGFYEFYPGIENPAVSRILATPEGRGYALYLSDRWQATAATGLQLGLRWDRQTWTEPVFGAQFSPRVSLLHAFDSATEVRLTWGRYHQSQGVQELQVEDGQSRFFAPQRADHWIAGIQHRFAGAYRLRAEAYLKTYDRPRPRFENLFDPLALIPELAPDRVRLAPTSARAGGVELTLEYRGGEELEWWTTYSWSRVADSFDGATEPRSWDQRHAVQAGLAWRSGPWEIGLALSVHSGWPTTAMSYLAVPGEHADDTIYLPVPGPRNAEQLGTFAQIDFRVSREFSTSRGRLSAFFEVTNATNRNNPCCIDYDIDENPAGEIFLDSSVDHWLPLIPAVGLLWTF